MNWLRAGQVGFKNNQHVTLSLPATVASCLAAMTREKTVLSLGKQKNGGGRSVIRLDWRSFSGGAAGLQPCVSGTWIFRMGLTLAPSPTALTMFTCQLSDIAKQHGLVQV